MSQRESQLVTCETEREPEKRSPSASRRVIWNLALGVAGLGYIILALCLNVQSPVFATLFVLAAAYEVIGSHSGHSRS